LAQPDLSGAPSPDFGAAGRHYVRAGASGSGDGTDWNNACPDFSGACAPANLVRGDVYYVAAGRYTNQTFDTPESGALVIMIRKATLTDHGSASGWMNGFAGQAVITGANTVTTGYWTFDGQTGDYLTGGIGSYGFKFDFSEGEVAITNRGNFNTFRY